MLGIANSGERGNVSLWFARRCNLLATRRSSFSASSSVFRATLSAFLVAFAVAFFVRSAALAARRFSASFCARLASKARRCCEAALLDGLRVRPLAVGGGRVPARPLPPLPPKKRIHRGVKSYCWRWCLLPRATPPLRRRVWRAGSGIRSLAVIAGMAKMNPPSAAGAGSRLTGCATRLPRYWPVWPCPRQYCYRF